MKWYWLEIRNKNTRRLKALMQFDHERDAEIALHAAMRVMVNVECVIYTT